MYWNGLDGKYWIGKDWIGKDWIGNDWIGKKLIGKDWIRKNFIKLLYNNVEAKPECKDLVLAWYGLVRVC